MNGKVVQLREASDWFCLPEYRQFGLGVQLMGSLMDEEEPLVVIGGNENAQALLPALGWNRIPHVNTYTLPLTTKWLVSQVWRRLPLPKCLNASARLRDISGLSAASPQVHTWCQHLTLLEKTQAVTQPAGGYALTPLLRADELEWLYSAPQGMGSFFCLVFPENIVGGGFVIGRFYCYGISKHMKLIHVQTSSPSVECYASILSAAIQYALECKADVAQFRASCPFLQRALEEVGFIWSTPTPGYWWANGASVPESFHLTFLRGDDGIRPYPS